jgi:hypothetical protein
MELWCSRKKLSSSGVFLRRGGQNMKTTMTKRFTCLAALALGISTVLLSSASSWARSPRYSTTEPYYDRDYYDQEDDRRRYDDYELPYGSYDPYERTITIPVPVPDLPRGTEKVIEGALELLLGNH